jgi:RNA polymerase sigma factor (sigma-70 family)
MSPRISIRLLASQPDRRLAALAGEGHERAFEALVDRYRRPLLRYCRSLRLGDARAEDVLQQAFLQAWLAFARGTEVRDVRPWLYRIVHNAAVNAMRGHADAHGELTETVQASASLAGESNLQRAMAVRDALTDVAALPQMQQQAIFLTAVDGQSNDEVADVLGISEGALRGLLYRARTTLRSAAAALTPPPLLAWAAGGPGAAGPTAERIAELSAGGGAAGIAGLLLKGAVVAVTAGALATGATVASSDSRGVRPPVHRSSPAASTGSADVSRGAVLEPGRSAAGRAPGRGSRRHGEGSDSGRGRKGSDGGHGRSSTEDRRADSSSDDGARDGGSGSGSQASHGGSGDNDGSSGSSGRQSSSGGKGDGRDDGSSGGASSATGSGGRQGSSGGLSKGGSDDVQSPAEQATQPQQAVPAQPTQQPGTAGTDAGAGESTTADDRSGRGSPGGSGSDG